MREYDAGKIEKESEERGIFSGGLVGKIKEVRKKERRCLVVVFLHRMRECNAGRIEREVKERGGFSGGLGR